MSNWHEASLAYRQHLLETGRTPCTAEVAKFHLHRLAEFCRERGILGPAQTRREDLDAYFRHIANVPGPRGRLWGENLQTAARARIHHFFRWAVASCLVLVHPAPERVQPRKSDPMIYVPTESELARLLEQPDVNAPYGLRDRVMLELLYSVGLRRRECWALDLQDVDLVEAQLTVCLGKGAKTRIVPIGPALGRWLRRYLETGRDALRPLPGEKALFVGSQNGERLGYESIRLTLSRYVKKAGLRHITLHTLRHACATHLLVAGADLREVQELLGHAQVSSTQRYTKLQPVELIEEHRRTHPRP